MDQRERLVRKVVRECFNEVVGGYENSVLDYGTPLPPTEQMFEEVYGEVMHCRMVGGFNGPQLVEKDIRFLGSARIRPAVRAHHGLLTA